MASDQVIRYPVLLEQAVLLVKMCPNLHESLIIEECRHWKGEADRLEVSPFLFCFFALFECFSIVCAAIASGCDSH